MGKMGISTLASYKGAQIFEAVGISADVIDMAFRGTASRIEGIGFEVIAEETILRHEVGYPSRTETERLPVLPNYGNVHWRHGGEKHMWNPFTIAELQAAARAGDKTAYAVRQTRQRADPQGRTLRGLLKFGPARRSRSRRSNRPARS